MERKSVKGWIIVTINNNFKYIRIFSILFWIIIWESFSLNDPVLHYFGMFLGIVVIGTILNKIKPIVDKI